MLEKILSPADTRLLSVQETRALASEIRQALIDSVAKNGGHLASNLGAVELTLALHRAFDTPVDKVIFDVGHQCYTHKMITGRKAGFSSLRAEGGLSGFPKRDESAYDVFETGHASTAISAALGLARARDARCESHAVAAVVGDGALTGGLCYEALNDAGSRPTQLVVLLNDNNMSIARNVGALSHYLTRMRGSPGWLRAKRTVKSGLSRVPLVGRPLVSGIDKIKRTLKLLLVPGEFFEALGFAYLGPVDGHDVAVLEAVLRDARAMNRPVVVHAVTQKGKGYALAERKPEHFHGVAPFFVDNGKAVPSGGAEVSCAAVSGGQLLKMAAERPEIVAVTAAMAHGTGLSAFAEAYPDRFFDVGIAEGHAVTLAAGMALGGLRPYFAVYASFLQRALDQLLHDVCMQNLPVTLLIDHAGFVSGDGATHQGVYELSMLRAMPNLTVLAPCDARELAEMVAHSAGHPGPLAIRCPKSLPERLGGDAGLVGAWRRVKACEGGGTDVALIGYGASVRVALDATARLSGVRCDVWSASSIQPMDAQALGAIRSAARLVAVVEEQQTHGGLGEAVAAFFCGSPGARVLILGVEGVAPGNHSVEGLRRACGLDAARVGERILEALHGG